MFNNILDAPLPFMWQSKTDVTETVDVTQNFKNQDFENFFVKCIFFMQIVLIT